MLLTPMANQRNLQSENFQVYLCQQSHSPIICHHFVDTGGNFAICVVDTSGKFAAGAVDIDGNFATGVVDTSGAS